MFQALPLLKLQLLETMPRAERFWEENVKPCFQKTCGNPAESKYQARRHFTNCPPGLSWKKRTSRGEVYQKSFLDVLCMRLVFINAAMKLDKTSVINCVHVA